MRCVCVRVMLYAFNSPSICLLMDAIVPVADGKVILPIADVVDNADVANCGKPADTYAAAKFGSVPILFTSFHILYSNIFSFFVRKYTG